MMGYSKFSGPISSMIIVVRYAWKSPTTSIVRHARDHFDHSSKHDSVYRSAKQRRCLGWGHGNWPMVDRTTRLDSDLAWNWYEISEENVVPFFSYVVLVQTTASTTCSNTFGFDSLIWIWDTCKILSIKRRK